jgi:hypothetical protein
MFARTTCLMQIADDQSNIITMDAILAGGLVGGGV